MAQALIDAAIIYGAQRYFDRLHYSSGWEYTEKYKVEDDRLFFLELMHYALIYEKLSLDTSSLESDTSAELRVFIEKVNNSLGFEWIDRKNVGERAQVDVDSSKHYFCRLLVHSLERDPGAGARFLSAPVPWAYYQTWHHDREYFVRKFEQFGIDDRVIPFAIFVWRALTYGAIAMHMVKSEGADFAYVAAPGRLGAMKYLLGQAEIRKYGGLPRELIKELRWGIPDFPSGGFDFTQLDSIPFFGSSPVGNRLFDADPREAMFMIADVRNSLAAAKLRSDWQEVLFDTSNFASVGMVNIQILRDATASGSINQTMRIKANPVEGDA